MTDPTQAEAPAAVTPRPLFTQVELVDLRRRVLAGEPVSDEDLRHAVDSIQNNHGASAAAKAAKTAPVNTGPVVSLADRFAAFKAKTETK